MHAYSKILSIIGFLPIALLGMEIPEKKPHPIMLGIKDFHTWTAQNGSPMTNIPSHYHRALTPNGKELFHDSLFCSEPIDSDDAAKAVIITTDWFHFFWINDTTPCLATEGVFHILNRERLAAINGFAIYPSIEQTLEDKKFASSTSQKDVRYFRINKNTVGLFLEHSSECGAGIRLISYDTAEGAMAGPKTLEHMVDAVFYLQGEDRWQTRILRSVKNRFGPVHELGFFEMHETGMNEMTNINAHLLSHAQSTPGSVLTSTLEGSRPLLLELQSLAVPTKYGTPQRVISGLDHTQVALITAILEKYLNVKLGSHDIFCKVSGGLKIKGSGSDLATALALLSSYFQKPVPYKSLALGEIALTGHVRPINAFGLYAGEARKFGIPLLYVARGQKHDLPKDMVCEIGHVNELIDSLI